MTQKTEQFELKLIFFGRKALNANVLYISPEIVCACRSCSVFSSSKKCPRLECFEREEDLLQNGILHLVLRLSRSLGIALES